MKSLRELVGAMAGRNYWRSMTRPRADRRRIRPFAEPMEGRAMLSQIGLGGAIHASVGAMDSGGSNGQVEVQPGDAVLASVGLGGAVHAGLRAMDSGGSNGQVEVQPGDAALVSLHVRG